MATVTIELNEEHLAVMRVVHTIGDPLMDHIVSGSGLSRERAREVVRALVSAGYLRMKEDSIDHAWSYRFTAFGREEFAGASGSA